METCGRAVVARLETGHNKNRIGSVGACHNEILPYDKESPPSNQPSGEIPRRRPGCCIRAIPFASSSEKRGPHVRPTPP